jgi:hypothetical protein
VKESLKVDMQNLHNSAKRQPLHIGGPRKPQQSLLYKFCVGVGTVCGVKIYAGSILVSCQPLQSRIAGLKYDGYVEEDPEFDWRKFFALLWPHIWYLLAAVAVCLSNIYKNMTFLLVSVCYMFVTAYLIKYIQR